MNSSNTDGVYDKTGYRDYWTIWYNVDTPWDNDGDYETVERIQKAFNKICNKGYQICAAHCEVEGQIFDQSTYPTNDSDILERRCTSEGLICRNKDQSPGSGRCQDYQIQFRCHYAGDSTSSTSFFNPFDIRIYIILALVPLLLIFGRMLWVYVYRRRQHQRRNPAPRGSSGNGVNDLAKPPPLYQDLFGKNGSIFAISRENLPVCSFCQYAPCSVALIISEIRASDNSKGNKQPGQMEIGSVSRVLEETQTVNTISDTDDRSSTSMETRLSNLSQVASSSEETIVCVDSSDTTDVYIEINSNKVSPNHEPALEPAQINGIDNINANNEIFDESYPNRNILVNSQASESPTSCEVLPGSSHLTLSLNTVSLKSSNISEPCACECHRTIPSKQKGVSGYVNSGYTAVENDIQTNKHPVFVNMHKPAFANDEVQLEMSRSPSLTQLELPTYEDALELMKLKEQ